MDKELQYGRIKAKFTISVHKPSARLYINGAEAISRGAKLCLDISTGEMVKSQSHRAYVGQFSAKELADLRAWAETVMASP